ncbi:MAG: PTS sugar transporter subunit IIA [Endomicrobium sp.]|jgi:PTS system mannose-specific IIA component|nr:PTS sugar transporter subunit IIA [Endomicrobium sp.]
MIKIVIAAHGELAQELVNSAEIIAGKQSNLYAVNRDINDSLMLMYDRVNSLLKNINDKDGTLILTDMLGGTPCNAAVPMCKAFDTEILSGVNLPMVLSAIFSSRNAASASDVAEKVLIDGQKSIINVKEVLLKKIK